MTWTIGGIVTTLLATVVIAIVSDRRAHPKRQLEYTVRTRRLVQASPDLGLQIRANGIEVPDPYLVEFRLRSNSRADIPSSAFDAGKNLLIRVEPGGAFVLGTEGARGAIRTNAGHGEGWDWAEFSVGPQLIRPGAVLELNWISNGEPTVKADSPLVDVPVVDASRRPSTFGVVSATLWTAVLVVSAVAIVVLAFARPDPDRPAWLVAVAVTAYVAIALWATASLTSKRRWRRRS